MSRKMTQPEQESKQFVQEIAQIAGRIGETVRNSPLSQEAFAQKVGVTRGTLNNWIKGETDKIPVTGLLAIAAAGNVSPEWLLSGAKSDLSREEDGLQPIATGIMTGAGEVTPPVPGSHLDNLLQIQAGLLMAMRENQRQIGLEIARLRIARRGASDDLGQDQ